MTPIEHIESLFVTQGRSAYDGARRESVTALEHALQCAQLAEWAHAPAPLVAAAFLHDIGHFIAPQDQDDGSDDAHELRALSLLVDAFGENVIEPVRLHVQAKRYLAAVDPVYAAALSPASVHSLALQGGPMSADERARFDTLPYAAADALALRRWDDLAKQPGRVTPPLGYFIAMLREL